MTFDPRGVKRGSLHWIVTPKGPILMAWYGHHFGQGGGTFTPSEVEQFGWTYFGPVLSAHEVAALQRRTAELERTLADPNHEVWGRVAATIRVDASDLTSSGTTADTIRKMLVETSHE